MIDFVIPPLSTKFIQGVNGKVKCVPKCSKRNLRLVNTSKDIPYWTRVGFSKFQPLVIPMYTYFHRLKEANLKRL